MTARPSVRGPALAIGGAVLGAAVWWRAHPSACPYGQRFGVEAPHPLLSRDRLREVLEPQPREHVLQAGRIGELFGDRHWASPVGRLERDRRAQRGLPEAATAV